MRKLKLQVQVTVDGFVAGPNGEMDFLTWNWDDALKAHVEALTASMDTIVMGRKLAEGFIPYWAGVAADPANPEAASGRVFTDTPKVVFSRTLESSPWPNATIARGELAEEIGRLKREPGRDLMAYGGASFVSSLIAQDLVDEYNLFVNPAAIGRGLSIFHGQERRHDLALAEATPFACGIVALRYQPRRA